MSGADRFFHYRSFDEEIAGKLASLETPSATLFDAWVSELPEATVDREKLCRLFAALQALELDRIYPFYLNHPIRVAAAYARLRPRQATTEQMAFALCHNAIEVDCLDSLPAGYLTPATERQIRCLTIDRSREKDVAYRRSFYDAIAAHSPDLLVFKALDKLDNTFWWVRFDLEAYHVDVVTQEVLPRLEAVDSKLAGYLGGLVAHVLRPETKARYRAETS